MKSLALLRHAKSSWDSPGLDDFDRPLNERGREAARLVGRELKRRKLHFDHVIASPAARVRETLDGLAEAYEALDVHFDGRIYLADPATLLDLVRNLPDAAGSALLVGHNPGLHQLALRLTVDDGEGLRTRIAERYPTGAFARIELSADTWTEVGDEAGTATTLILPREIAG